MIKTGTVKNVKTGRQTLHDLSIFLPKMAAKLSNFSAYLLRDLLCLSLAPVV